MTDIVIYTKDWCGYCHAAKQLLNKLGYPFREVDVTHDQEQLGEMFKRSGGRRTVPQIFIDGAGIGGYTDLARLMREGKLPETGSA